MKLRRLIFLRVNIIYILRLSFCLIIFPLFLVVVKAGGEGCRAYRSSDIAIGSGSWTAVAFNAEYWDDSAYHDNSSNPSQIIFDHGIVGRYNVCCSLAMAVNATGLRGVAIVTNGTGYIARVIQDAPSAGVYFGTVCSDWNFTDSDYVECYAYQNSGGTLTVTLGASSSFMVARFTDTLANHAETHEDGGDDEIDVSDLSGILADGQNAGWIDTMGVIFPDGCGGTSVLRWDAEGEYWTCDYVPEHGSRHQNGGADEINVLNLSGLLAEPQDAGWFHGLAITTTGVISGQVLAWNGSQWEPTNVTGAGGISDVVEISGTVGCILTDTYHFTNTLSSGYDMAVIRSFTYGEASIAIGLFLVAAMIGLLAVLWFVRR